MRRAIILILLAVAFILFGAAALGAAKSWLIPAGLALVSAALFVDHWKE